MTAIVNEKLKVDHEFTVFNTNGHKIKTVKMKVFDLINVDFAFQTKPKTKKTLKKIPRDFAPLGLLQCLPDKPGKITED